MKKTEVYSWRMNPSTRTAMENEARRERTTIAGLLDRITKEWMDSKRGQPDEEAEQENLHARVRKTIGTISGSDPNRSERARSDIRRSLRGRHGR